MRHRVEMFPMRSVLVLLCLAALCYACVTVPLPSGQPGAAEQNAATTPAFALTQLPADQKAMPPDAGSAPKHNDCPGLDSALVQIMRSSDPIAQAKQSLLQLRDGDKIQVVLVLSQRDTRFLHAYDVEIGTQADMQVQAYVPLDRLCDLAKTAEVLAINLPAQAISQ